MRIKTALMFTAHNAFGPRFASAHFTAQHLVNSGIQTGMVTVRLSLLSRLKNDGRYNFARQRPVNSWLHTPQGVDAFVWFAPFHPYNLHNAVANAAATPLYESYPYLLPASLVRRIRGTELFLIESGLPLILTRRLRLLAPDATFIYLASDRLQLLNVHPMIQKAERSQLNSFHLIRTLAEAQVADFPNHPNVHCIASGIDKATFDRPHPNPFSSPNNVVLIGGMLFDAEAVRNLATRNPDYNFHLFGGELHFPFSLANVYIYGETAFSRLVPFIKHADIGLSPYQDHPTADYLSQSSLKLIQYTYCKLPIVAPKFTKSPSRHHICGYDPNCPISQQQAFEIAKSYCRESISTAGIGTWDEVVGKILSHAGINTTCRV